MKLTKSPLLKKQPCTCEHHITAAECPCAYFSYQQGREEGIRETVEELSKGNYVITIPVDSKPLVVCGAHVIALLLKQKEDEKEN